jgi:hypothetical protein
MDSTTVTLFKDILRGCGRLPKEGKKKGGIKAHTMTDLSYGMPCPVRYTEAAKHDRVLLCEVHLEKGPYITFDRGYGDYSEYECFTAEGVFYVARIKDNAKYDAGEEFDSPDEADGGVLKDEKIILHYGKKKGGELKHRSRRIAYWDAENRRLFEFITNNFEPAAGKVALGYKKTMANRIAVQTIQTEFSAEKLFR